MSMVTSHACGCSPTRSERGSCGWGDDRAHEYATARARTCDVFARIEDRHGAARRLSFARAEGHRLPNLRTDFRGDAGRGRERGRGPSVSPDDTARIVRDRWPSAHRRRPGWARMGPRVAP